MGLKPPNAWGLYDIVGNVYEWTSDRTSPPPNIGTPPPTVQGPTHAHRNAAFHRQLMESYERLLQTDYASVLCSQPKAA